MKTYNTINEAWYFACTECLESGYEYQIEKGSFEGHIRRQLEHMALCIEHPEVRPLAVSYKGKNVTTDLQINDYFAEYLISGKLRENETYTYGHRMYPFLSATIDKLKETPGTNQACLEIASPSDVLMVHPPCLRLVDFKAGDGKINLHAYFRSWDLYAGFPMNVAGLQLLNEYVAHEADMKTGKMFLYSSGAHLYDYAWCVFN